MPHRILPSGTIFTSLSSDILRDTIVETISKLQPNFTFKHFASNENKITSLEPILHWQSLKGIVPSEPVTFAYNCYITDEDSNSETNSNIIYALFEKKIPVIRFFSGTTECKLSNHLLHRVDGFSHDKKEQAIETVQRYFSFPEQPGRVIVIEGGDGAGKQTQTGLLLKKLAESGKKVATVDFPHDAARYGVLIREALAGHKGALKDVSPLVFGSLYGLNRHDLKPEIDNWLLQGTIVVFDRWTTANYGHQASKFKTDELRDDAINALRVFEERWLGLPRADRVFYLDLPPVVAYQAMLADTSRKELDLHEKAGIEYKENVRKAFIWCCNRFADSWVHVPCWDEKKEARIAREEIHETLWKNVEGLL